MFYQTQLTWKFHGLVTGTQILIDSYKDKISKEIIPFLNTLFIFSKNI